MRGTPSRKTTSASLPRERKIWQQARTEPMASPSGRACEVSRNRWWRSSCSRTSFSMAVRNPQTGLAAPPLGAAQEFVNPSRKLPGSVHLEKQLRRAPQLQPVAHFAPDKPHGSSQPFKRPAGLGIVSIDGDQDACRAGIFRHDHAAHACESDARVAQFPFHQDLDLLAQSLPQALPMIFLSAPLHLFTTSE